MYVCICFSTATTTDGTSDNTRPVATCWTSRSRSQVSGGRGLPPPPAHVHAGAASPTRPVSAGKA